MSPFHVIVFIAILAILCCTIVSSQTSIDGLWIDDFLMDETQANGWYIYNPIAGDLGNIIVQGSKDYHGKFSRIGDTGKYNYMKREFKCVADSKVFISYKYAYCKTEYDDKITMEWTGSTTTTREDGMESTTGTTFSNIETSNIFENSIQPVRGACDTANEWKYRTVNELVGNVEGGVVWQLSFTHKLSGNREYTLLFDVSINCDRLVPAETPIKPAIVEPPTEPPTEPPIEPPIVEIPIVETPIETPVTEPITPIIVTEFCCHPTMSLSNFDMWNGYCLMVTLASECNEIPNGRCEWRANDCFPNPQCSMKDDPCRDDSECCSKACLYQNVINGAGGKCR